MSEPRERYDHNANNVTGTPVDEENDLVPIQLWREQQAEIERMHQLQSAYDCLTPQQYHACLSRLWAALGNPPMDGRDVFTRVADEIVGLQAIITAKLHRRRCHDCGHVGWYADSRTPYCLCDQCRSQDTRRLREAK